MLKILYRVFPASRVHLHCGCEGNRNNNGWRYIGCSNCSGKLDRGFKSFTCVSCNNEATVEVVRTYTTKKDQ
ncbi:hypothetical protein Bca101_060553 [Brassica carinata]